MTRADRSRPKLSNGSSLAVTVQKEQDCVQMGSRDLTYDARGIRTQDRLCGTLMISQVGRTLLWEGVRGCVWIVKTRCVGLLDYTRWIRVQNVLVIWVLPIGGRLPLSSLGFGNQWARALGHTALPMGR